MSEEMSIEDLCIIKISQEFEIYEKRKTKIELGNNVQIDTERLSEIEKKLESCKMPDKIKLAEMYMEHAQLLRQEIQDGNFSARKKCDHCKIFYQDYETKKGILPCPKMQSYQKMIDPDRKKLTEEEYREIYDGQLRCGKLYLPVQNQEKINKDLAKLEREQMEAINEWLEIALFELDNH